MRERGANELKTSFASHYARSFSLREALELEVIAAHGKQAAGAKYLITPHAT